MAWRGVPPVFVDTDCEDKYFKSFLSLAKSLFPVLAAGMHHSYEDGISPSRRTHT